MFLPMTRAEMEKRGWTELDVILITGDAYIDSPFSGVAIIGRVLEDAGYRVGIIACPDPRDEDAFKALGKPKLFWGITAGAMDSMVANYTPLGKRRFQDDLLPEGKLTRPDRATIVYTNTILRLFGREVPIILGGIEASLRRIIHYDYWDDDLRRSVLMDSKADYLVYGMGEKTILEIAHKLARNEDIRDIRGLCYLSSSPPPEGIELPGWDEVKKDPLAFIEMFHLFYANQDPITGKRLFQRQTPNDAPPRYLIHNPPALPLTTEELDHVYELPYEHDAHPLHKKQGRIRALETIQFSLTTHRGCYGGCHFCAIGVHQGRWIISRSEDSLLREAKRLTKHPAFKGYFFDVGGPTANMWQMDCAKKAKSGACRERHCLLPHPCERLIPSHERQIRLLQAIRRLPGVKGVFVASGIRPDLVYADPDGEAYVREIAFYHTSGQLKLAPEHTESKILSLMGKPDLETLLRFRRDFLRFSHEAGKKQFLSYYFIAAYPGCSREDMIKAKHFIQKHLHLTPEQVQIFTPTPSTYASVMYYTERDPFHPERKLFVEKNPSEKQKQKDILQTSLEKAKKKP
ncbi:YgiQ family radical SAM protein [Thermospira aquatica]|uniref:YgiQ family radical SAM protein n=1 Tax=Thermospira aquatica TaxID=2828656 RepID=A0AAX3BDR8_9SPIR|nr:YgiQ family radical SAM protein [Thermospira aquatica]URA10376.1 YgiQ family radical SAM protein [Thermospira aquatica]